MSRYMSCSRCQSEASGVVFLSRLSRRSESRPPWGYPGPGGWQKDIRRDFPSKRLANVFPNLLFRLPLPVYFLDNRNLVLSPSGQGALQIEIVFSGDEKCS